MPSTSSRVEAIKWEPWPPISSVCVCTVLGGGVCSSTSRSQGPSHRHFSAPGCVNFLSLFFASHSARISDSGEPFRSQTTKRYLSKFSLLLVVTIDIHIFTLESSPVLMIPFFWVLWAQKAFIYIDFKLFGVFLFVLENLMFSGF